MTKIKAVDVDLEKLVEDIPLGSFDIPLLGKRSTKNHIHGKPQIAKCVASQDKRGLWHLLVWCPYCQQRHEHLGGYSEAPRLRVKDSHCGLGSYEFGVIDDEHYHGKVKG